MNANKYSYNPETGVMICQGERFERMDSAPCPECGSPLFITERNMNGHRRVFGFCAAGKCGDLRMNEGAEAATVPELISRLEETLNLATNI